MIGALRTGAIVVCLVLALFFTLVSATGVLRLPDIYSRAHTASQADTLGAGFAVAGVALAFGVQSPTVKTVLLLVFIFVTNPTAAHAIARSADAGDVEAWTVDDDRNDVALANGSSDSGPDAEELGGEDV